MNYITFLLYFKHIIIQALLYNPMILEELPYHSNVLPTDDFRKLKNFSFLKVAIQFRSLFLYLVAT